MLQREGFNSKKSGCLPNHYRKMGILLAGNWCTLRVQFSGQFCHIYIGGVECTASKFAGGTRLGDAFDSFEGQDALQRDVDTLEH